ncbi:hypothetical protein [Spirilliplanes yamanashiensis]|uniref:Uncharacterized protein n=1 Tax=Spirilliplanes yamanashiensis TaxID=42233 RepID=A0A8J3Y6F8_9ACTN|nr:hypothetical protein [Spirilliplanes yamanashiensis]GIJ02731.1 hypothetical protein Sya03_20830 [Spirilliplanes yamanashiensis]
MTLQEASFRGFANPVDPTADELRAWAYHPNAVPLEQMPPDWDLLLSTDDLVGTLFDLAMDRSCPARRFAQHCLYIYAADGVRQNATGHRKRKLRKLVERADQWGDETMHIWAHNCRVLMSRPELLDYEEWCEGGLVRHPRRIGLFQPRRHD